MRRNIYQNTADFILNFDSKLSDVEFQRCSNIKPTFHWNWFTQTH